MHPLRTFFRVLTAIVALYAANDFLLQPFAYTGAPGFKHIHARPLFAVLAAHAEDDDENHLVLGADGAATVPRPPVVERPWTSRTLLSSRIDRAAPPVRLARSGHARAPPSEIQVTA